MIRLTSPVSRNKETGIWTAEVNNPEQAKQKILFEVSQPNKVIYMSGKVVVRFDENRNATVCKESFKIAFPMPMDDENIMIVFEDMIKKAKVHIFLNN